MGKNSEKAKRSQKRKKIEIIERYGGKCQKCGYDKCINALEFHHLYDKKEKPSYIIIRWKWEKVKKELDKCALLCANCHRETHYVPDGDLGYLNFVSWIEKDCKFCQKKFETRKKDQVFCGLLCKQKSERKVLHPSKMCLEKMIKQKPFSQIGKDFGVTDNTIRKWCKKYGIDTKIYGRGYWQKKAAGKI